MNYLQEIEHYGLRFDYTGSADWVSVVCPFHDDTNPSCGVSLEHGGFKCHACGATGDFAKLLSASLKLDRKQVQLDLASRNGTLKAEDRPIEQVEVERLHSRIWQAMPLLAALHVRGVTREQIEEHKLGEEKGRVTIPVYNDGGMCVNIISYSPGARQRKFLNRKGRGKKARIYPQGQLGYSQILLVGGCIKAIAAAAVLNPHGYGVITSTNGEEADGWPEGIGSLLADKDWVGVCGDVDDAGLRHAEALCRKIHPHNKAVHVVVLPLDREKYPKGDISNFLGEEGGDPLPLLEEAKPYDPPDILRNTSKAAPVASTLLSASKAVMADRRVGFRAMVVAFEAEAFFVPDKVVVHCHRDQPMCTHCPIYVGPAIPVEQVDPEHPAILEMAGAKKAVQKEAIKSALGIPACKPVRFETVSYHHVQSALLGPDLDSPEDANRLVLSATTVNAPLEANETYDLVGRIVPHPNSQRATALVSERLAIKDTLDEYEHDPTGFEVFSPDYWEVDAIERHLDDLYHDLEVHVTKIQKRRDMHLFLDLAWHSVLQIKPADEHLVRPVKGWTEILVVGDSGQGKTETVNALMHHYRLGQKIDCKGATVAGIVGGLEKVNERWFIKWGAMPRNNRRLLVLEELKGARPEVIAKLTETRSSGIADIPKIEHGKAQCRTRLIGLSNPPEGNVADYATGVQIVAELIPNPEDVRRFDAIMVVAKEDIPSGVASLPPLQMNGTPPVFTSGLCHRLLLWGWTRKPEQVVYEDWGHLLEMTRDVVASYSDAVPIVDAGGMRYKLARLSAALAVRTYSHADDDHETLLVRKCHVECIVNLLRRTYNSSAFGYDRYSAAVNKEVHLRNPYAVTSRVNQVPHTLDFIDCILSVNNIDIADVADWSTGDMVDAREIVSILVRNNALVRKGKHYRKTAPFITLLTELRVAAEKDAQLPAHIKKPTL